MAKCAICDKGVHFGMNGKIILHRALGQGHFGLVGGLDHAVITKGNNALVVIHNHATHFARRILGLAGGHLRNPHKIFIPFVLFGHITLIIT